MIPLALVAMTGCIGQAKPAPAVERYALQYDPPPTTGRAAADTGAAGARGATTALGCGGCTGARATV